MVNATILSYQIFNINNLEQLDLFLKIYVSLLFYSNILSYQKI